MKIEYIIELFGKCTNRYHVTAGRAKRICRTNGWRLEPGSYTKYQVVRKKDNQFMGHYDDVNNTLYVILENGRNMAKHAPLPDGGCVIAFTQSD